MLHTLERATSLGSADLKLSGKPLNHTLLHAGFFRAALKALAAPEPDVSTGTLLERAFPSEASRWFLRDLPEMTSVRPQARAALNTFHAWRTFIEPLIPWAPSKDMGQHGSLETLDGFATARERFAGVPWALEALDVALGIAEQENSDLPEGWLRNAERSWYGLTFDAERRVATTPEAVRDALKDLADDTLFSERRELFVVQDGRIAQTIELSPLIRVKAGDAIAKLSEAAAEELALLDDAEVIFQWDEIAQVLPPLSGAPLPKNAPAMLRVPEPAPAWLREDEQYQEVLHFDA